MTFRKPAKKEIFYFFLVALFYGTAIGMLPSRVGKNMLKKG